MNVTLYTTGSRCIRCRLTAHLLKNLGVAFTTLDIRTDTSAHHDVSEELGYVEAPVVVVTDFPAPGVTDLDDPAGTATNEGPRRHHWSGFRPERLHALAGAASEPQDTEHAPVGAS